ncbi:MAG: DnaD domain protein [Acutalibacteraceae bacterium]|nr:DnaD domain protein [Acutalibacteraceae bacterium]
MNYRINPTVFSAVFTVPAAVADNHLKLARGEHIKVLLYIMRNMTAPIEPDKIAKAVGITEYDAKEALIYWEDAGILSCDKDAAENKEIKPKATSRAEKPSRNDVARRGAEDEKVSYLLRETQMRLGRNLKSNEASTLVWLYDDEGLDVSLILMIVQYAAAHNKANIRFIESTAVDWINKGIDSVAEADNELNRLAMGEQAWKIVSSAFGLERRKPSKKETELSLIWLNDWKVSKEMLEAAYEECVNAKSKFSFAYTAKIIESWHKNGFKTPDDIQKQKKNDDNDGFAAYDIDLFEKMLNTKD